MDEKWEKWDTLVDMAPRSAGRTSNPNKPGYFNTAFEQTKDHHQYHEEEFYLCKIIFPHMSDQIDCWMLVMRAQTQGVKTPIGRISW